MDRRSFLIGSSSLLTTAYLTKADWFLKNKKSVVIANDPLIHLFENWIHHFLLNRSINLQ